MNVMKPSVLGYSPTELEKIPNYILYIKMLENLDNTIGNLVEQTSELNKTMAGIAETLRWMQRK